MKINRKYTIRRIASQSVIIDTDDCVDLTRIISLNDTARWLWQQLAQLDGFDANDCARLLMEEYGIDRSTADCDSLRWIEQMRLAGLIDD